MEDISEVLQTHVGLIADAETTVTATVKAEESERLHDLATQMERVTCGTASTVLVRSVEVKHDPVLPDDYRRVEVTLRGVGPTRAEVQ